MNQKPSFLIVDDDPSTLLYLKTFLEKQGYRATTAGSCKELFQALEEKDFDAILLDLQLPDGDGLAVMATIQDALPGIPILIITAFGSVESAVEAMRRGAYDYCTKPFDMNRLMISLKNALERRWLLKKVSQFEKSRRSGLCEMIGGSPEIQVVYQMIETVAPTQASVFITGESGTGKELAARAIHQLSPRRQHQLVDVNCAAIPKDLLESELFGHERSAFTGATRQYIGRCEQAHLGTLFLDEIAEMEINLQPKLLRFLQERSLSRVGGRNKIQVDTRVISATNREPQKAIAQGQLREDLFYRLNVVNINIPPLRERRSDIPDLARFFMQKYARENQKPFEELSPEAEEALCRYNWSGNIRELENCIHQAVILYSGSVLERAMLPEPIRQIPLELETPASPATHSPASSRTNDQEIIPLEDLEREAIDRALRITQGNVTKAATRLQLSQATLYRKIRDYGFIPKNYKGSNEE